jgi:lysophospholipase L1-like esterase
MLVAAAPGWAIPVRDDESVSGARCDARGRSTVDAAITMSGAVIAGVHAPARAVSGGGAHTRPIAAFLGDSYTSGYNGAGYGRSGWPAIVSASLHLRPFNRAVPGTGFVNPGWTGQPIRTEVAAVVRANPRIIFLVGGHNDRRFAPAASRAAAIAVIDQLRVALPDARLVVIGPLWSGDAAPPSLIRLRDVLRAKARAIGAEFIDPIAARWLAGSARQFIGPDGLHPTNAGHRHIAALVLRALRGSGHGAPTSHPASAATPAQGAASTASSLRRDIAPSSCAS